MAFDPVLYDDIIAAFTIDTEHLHQAAAAFRQDMRLGLTGSPDSSLRMLPSYLGLPTGEERGDYLALDFGGTNVRVLLYRLAGNGKYEMLSHVAKPLKVDGVYDFIGAEATGEEMFDFIAGLVDEVVGGDHETPYLLGHTFSFPSSQTNINNARLIIWTKEFAARGVEGEVVNDLLRAALVRQGLSNVTPNSVINDTVAVLLSAAYIYGDTKIGAIYATGHNTCYLESYTGTANAPMILNMESGGFSKLVPNRFDIALDAASEKKGEQRLEKMVSGRYMGELFGMALAELLGTKEHMHAFTSVDISRILEDVNGDAQSAASIVETATGQMLSAEDAVCVRELARTIVVRSVRLIAATFVGTLWQITGEGEIRPQHIAVDGSVYEKMPLVKETMADVFAELLGEDAPKVDTILASCGSGLGAALAAAMVESG
ncbi:hexokinase [Centipeda periodontii DSM 2778]|uniref:Hexokinase n=1 Tax=Centipeda periodontii DSM 2778 TaxID=888060 RepID=F5RKS9_9FIRM|nr:hexokinase [Centipeda periodontii]EGK60874.1 hexokinase [Centipeda periodontii DSM 2778]